jgi:putative flavoprotein involved in K+ transport
VSAEIAFIGAGPAGLATAACLRARGVAFRLLDRTGEPGGAYREIYPRTVLASPARYTALPGLAPSHAGEYITAGRYLEYLRAYADHHRLAVERAEVAEVERRGGGFVVRTADREHAARAVVVATGMWSFPRPAAIAGAPSVPVLHARQWQGPAALPAGDLLIIGGGTSAVELAEEAAAAGRRVFVAARAPVRLVRQRLFGRDLHDLLPLIERIPTWAARGYCARPKTTRAFDLGFSRLRAEGRISVHLGAPRIDGALVRLGDGAEVRVSAVVCATGYQFLAPFVPPEVARAPAGHLRARGSESVTWPGLFVVGAPCARGLLSEFLRGISRDTPRLARTLGARP